MRGVNETRGRRLPLHHRAVHRRRPSSSRPDPLSYHLVFKRTRELHSPHPYTLFLSPQLFAPQHIARVCSFPRRKHSVGSVLFFKETAGPAASCIPLLRMRKCLFSLRARLWTSDSFLDLQLVSDCADIIFGADDFLWEIKVDFPSKFRDMFFTVINNRWKFIL